MAYHPIALDLAATAEAVSLSKSTIQTMVSRGQFPKPRQLSAGRVAWLWRELEEWSEKRPPSEILPPANTGAKKPRSTKESCGLAHE